MSTFTSSRVFNCSVDEIFSWHTGLMALERITPPWDNIEVLNKISSDKIFLKGGELTLKQRILPFLYLNWTVVHKNYQQNKIFEDHLTKGPLKLWEHKHHFKKLGLKKTRIIDEINFSHWINLKSLNEYTLRRLKKSFDYRYDILSYDLSMLKKNLNKEIVLITGGTGNIGSHLVPHLNSLGYKIILLKYNKESSNEYEFKKLPLETHDILKIEWNPYSKKTIVLPNEISKRIKFLINLSGENIFGLWTKAKMKKIIESRLISTNSILEIIKKNKINLNCCIHSSAVGIYGSKPGREIDEYESKGKGFLADTTNKWEIEQNKFLKYSKRNINLRTGVVLSLNGGILGKIKIPFSLGVGAYFGSGSNHLSWIGIEDLVRIIGFALSNTMLDGPVNAVSPTPLTNIDFFSRLAKKLKSKILLRIPSYIPKSISKELTEEILLSDQIVKPSKLITSKYNFFTRSLDKALDNTFGF
ncbi:MAG TPA: TIGR01777 family protein [Candidatus Dadabacteria bacterium]|nr:TIGR01777 family protein [Candidatus Dadabacteria bacterium]